MLATMRDTSADYRTYWLRDGLYYAKARSLGEASCSLPADKLAQIPAADRALLLDEVKGSPAFCEKVARCMATRSDWAKLISSAAKEAIVNEFDPSKFKNRKGEWPKLRAHAQKLAEAAAMAIKNQISSMTLDQKVAAIKQISAGKKPLAPRLSGLGNLGFFDLLGSVISAAGNLYTTDLIADTNKDIAKIQATSAMQTVTAQQSIAQAQAAIAAAQTQQAAIQNPVGAAISTFTTSTVGGIPVLAILGVGGLAIWYILKRR